MNSVSIERIISIDILKVFAVLIVLNSHMKICYGSHLMLATGGAIGDALFFFCSGFTILLGHNKTFPNFYKRRILRIYPTVFITFLMSDLFFNKKLTAIDFLLGNGNWFICCIMIYYVLFHFIKKYFINYLIIVFIVSAGIVIASFYLIFNRIYQSAYYFIYMGSYIRWIFYFMFMLLGAIVGFRRENIKYTKFTIPMLLSCIILWYSCFWLSSNQLFLKIQYISLIPLLGITYFSYELCCWSFLKHVYNNRILGQILFVVGGLSLETYLIQELLFTDKLNMIFPLNIPIIMFYVLIIAYIVKFITGLLLQIVSTEDIEWKKCIYRKS